VPPNVNLEDVRRPASSGLNKVRGDALECKVSSISNVHGVSSDSGWVESM
jgi:hypothetical protein